MKSLEDVKKDVEDFLINTEEARILSERDRDYKDHKQWTSEEKSKIESRGQAAITVNRIKPKVEGLKGLLIQRKTDPKAWPRTPKHEKAAESITDGLRYVADNNDFDQIKLDVAENVFVEGYGAGIVQVTQEGEEIEITIEDIPWDRYYYDIHSRKLDFSDKRYDGIILWMDEEEVEEKFGVELSEEEEDSNENGQETFDDRPQWVDKREGRVRVCQHFYIDKGEWYMCYFTSTRFLVKPALSPYLNEYGEPVNPIESIAANIDRDNNRFGEVRYWIDLQDEINHRRSKYLFLLSTRQTMGRKGAISDIPALKREAAKPDGHFEYEGEKGDFEFVRTNDMADAQFTLLQDAKGELDAIGFNAQLSGERQGDLSGTAITNLQQAATNELSSLYAGITGWEKRIYRQIWMRIKQFWGAEKWLRVTDDSTKLRWVGLNQPVTVQEMLQEKAEDESLYLPERRQAQMQLQQMMEAQDPQLNEIVEIKNNVAQLDMDIIIETSYDSVNIQREQFELLSKIAQTRPDVPFTDVLKLSELRGKDKIIKSIEQSAQQNGQIQQQQAEIDNAEKQSKVQLNSAKAQKEAANSELAQANAFKSAKEGEQVELQTELLLDTPPDNTGVVI